MKKNKKLLINNFWIYLVLNAGMLAKRKEAFGDKLRHYRFFFRSIKRYFLLALAIETTDIPTFISTLLWTRAIIISAKVRVLLASVMQYLKQTSKIRRTPFPDGALFPQALSGFLYSHNEIDKLPSSRLFISIPLCWRRNSSVRKTRTSTY